MNMKLALNLLSVLILIIVLVVLYYIKRKEQAKWIIYSIVCEAERMFNSKTGVIKFAYVMGLAYPKLPTVIRLFVTQEQIGRWIDNGLIKLKKELAKAELNTLVSEVIVTEPIVINTDTPLSVTSE